MYEKFINLHPTQLKRAAAFIEELNNIKANHIGFCGTSYNDLLNTLQEDFVEDANTSIYVQMNEEEIVSLIAYDIDDDVAEVWGPFTKQQNDYELLELWQFATDHHPTVTQFQFFINEQNTKQIKFVVMLGAKKSGEHSYLMVKREEFEPISNQLSSHYTDSFALPFAEIHNEAFPNAYYNPDTIVRKIKEDKTNFLKLIISNSEVLGYAYYQLNLEERTAHIDFIAIKHSVKGKGLGTRLLKEISTHIFSHPEIEDISLTVNNTNKAAIHIYLKAGFTQVNVLWAYNLNK